MDTILELLITAGRFLAGIWPVMIVVVLFGIAKRRDGFKTMLRTSIKSLVVTWVFFAILRAVFSYLEMETFQLLPEPADTRYFLFVGLFLMPLALAIALEEHRKHQMIKSIDDMNLLSPSEFEKLVAKTYRDQGNRVEEVGSTGDHGIDLIVHTRKGETVLVQCKKYKGKVGEPIVRDFYGVLRASEADAGALVTTGLITPQARLWAEGKPIYLYDGRAFLKVIESTRYRRILPDEAVKEDSKPSAKPEAIRPNLQPATASASAAHSSSAIIRPGRYTEEGSLPDKTPFMDLSNTPDCPACGTP
ncbi:MAG: restriction endonuclease, partial [Anaerolineaceae bacterium]|nr:restriction endonuclease [Anaerolineaceae bacterium]